jgi:hypothetical protein
LVSAAANEARAMSKPAAPPRLPSVFKLTDEAYDSDE